MEEKGSFLFFTEEKELLRSTTYRWLRLQFERNARIFGIWSNWFNSVSMAVIFHWATTDVLPYFWKQTYFHHPLWWCWAESPIKKKPLQWSSVFNMVLTLPLLTELPSLISFLALTIFLYSFRPFNCFIYETMQSQEALAKYVSWKYLNQFLSLIASYKVFLFAFFYGHFFLSLPLFVTIFFFFLFCNRFFFCKVLSFFSSKYFQRFGSTSESKRGLTMLALRSTLWSFLYWWRQRAS